MSNAVLTSERLILREANPDDAEFMLQLISQKSWKKYIADHEISDVAGARDHLSTKIIPGYRNGRGLWLVALKDSGDAIGICGLVEREFLKDTDLGFAFLETHQGKGFAAEASHVVIEYSRNQLGLALLLAITVPENENSIKLLQRLGFHFKEEMSNPDDKRLSVYELKLGNAQASNINLV